MPAGPKKNHIPVYGASLVLIVGCALGPRPTAEPSLGIALVPGMQIGVVTTAVGGLVPRDRVDPNEPGGGMLVTIESVQPGVAVTVSWRGTVEREVPLEGPAPAVGVGTPAPTPRREIVTEEGKIATSALDDARAALLPLYWPSVEDTTTDTSLMWLSQEAFEELKSTRQTRWSADVLTMFSHLPELAIEQLAQISEATGGREIYLAAEADFVGFDLAVDGRKEQFQAIRAFDDYGNEYIILDDAENPLIVKFRFHAMSTGAIGIDAPLWVLIKAVFSGYQVVEIRQ